MAVSKQVEQSRATGSGLALAVIAPLVMWAVAWVLWSISDRLVIIGPIDRAKFGWFVVFPLIVLTPAVAGLTSFRLAIRWRVAAQSIIGCSIAVVMTAVIASGVQQIGCTPITSRAQAIPPSLAVGIIAGAAFAIAGALSATVAAKDHPRRWRAILAGVAGGVTAGTLWLMAYAAVFPGLSCSPFSLLP